MSKKNYTTILQENNTLTERVEKLEALFLMTAESLEAGGKFLSADDIASYLK